MTREEAIKRLEACKTGLIAVWTMNEDAADNIKQYVDAYDMAISALRELSLEKKQATSNWIPVEERLPEPETEVLARCRYQDAWHILACYVSERWYNQWYTIVAGQWVEVTHWMPLPSPPEVSE